MQGIAHLAGPEERNMGGRAGEKKATIEWVSGGNKTLREELDSVRARR